MNFDTLKTEALLAGVSTYQIRSIETYANVAKNNPELIPLADIQHLINITVSHKNRIINNPTEQTKMEVLQELIDFNKKPVITPTVSVPATQNAYNEVQNDAFVSKNTPAKKNYTGLLIIVGIAVAAYFIIKRKK